MAKLPRGANDGRDKLLNWLELACARYTLEPIAVYRAGRTPIFPLVAADEAELQAKLKAGSHFLPLPKEPAALANVLEVSIIEFLQAELAKVANVATRRGNERSYPDIEIEGGVFGDMPHALDIKAARRSITKKGQPGKNTKSRITLYTGNTYFRHQEILWPGMFRAFNTYSSHISLIALYTFDESASSRIADLELLTHQTWTIGSKERSSTTREYIGAVMALADLKAGSGEFGSEQEFYDYWHKQKFKTPPALEKQLKKLLADERKR